VVENITHILSVVLYGFETLREEHRLGCLRTGCLFGPKRKEVVGDWKDYIMRSFITCTLQQILLRCLKQGG